MTDRKLAWFKSFILASEGGGAGPDVQVLHPFSFSQGSAMPPSPVEIAGVTYEVVGYVDYQPRNWKGPRDTTKDVVVLREISEKKDEARHASARSKGRGKVNVSREEETV